MLAFAKDITKNKPTHPEEAKNPKLKEYMEYQRKLNHERLVYHSLDHAKTSLQKNMGELENQPEKLKEYIRKAFPVSHALATPENLVFMLRKLVNAHNSTNNWYRMNPFYSAVVYDSVERFLRIYNRLIRVNPEKAGDYKVSEGVEVSFDDWVQLYFHDLDFMIGRKPRYTHFLFQKRNKTIEEAIDREMKTGKSREDAVKGIRKEFEIDPAAEKVILGQTVTHQDLELFYTSVENPIYEYLYEADSSEGFMDGDPLIDHSYFLGHQFWGLSEEEAEATFKEVTEISKP